MLESSQHGRHIMALRTTTPIDFEALDEDGDGIVYLTGEDARAYFEDEVQRELGISGTEFLRRLDAGEYDEIYDDPDHREIGHLEMLSHVVR
jgi:hypothetical protein